MPWYRRHRKSAYSSPSMDLVHISATMNSASQKAE